MKSMRADSYALLLVTDLCIVVVTGDRCTVFDPQMLALSLCHPLSKLEKHETSFHLIQLYCTAVFGLFQGFVFVPFHEIIFH